jgi:hypothetical protein
MPAFWGKGRAELTEGSPAAGRVTGKQESFVSARAGLPGGISLTATQVTLAGASPRASFSVEQM